MGPADTLIFAFAALVDVAALALLRWRHARCQRRERVARSLVLAVRFQRV